ncbi:SDR family NAD(P)-dependent oxidoreductase [Actinotalea sp. BY-33]|uniref:SDR family NAD(P)-dependent oxidoreductase n=1 Tax=Actinotalea soli TaxID=2819234 RepID=A0A939RWP1_9CELL|nr:SDR family NAD(P)-dependent oxidoreductase [Actinotalea soli]MBO1752828.1 SDR family NAD(P)-dependent oxidoreductase [Actinotalea soli]
MSQRTIVITGASDGIGAAAARDLAAAGDRVIVVGRSPEKTRAVAEQAGAPFHLADFADLAQVRRLAEELRETSPRIDVLVNNAGGIMGPRALTGDGHEKTLQVNHLAPFLLTHLLMDVLTASSATVINTSSVAARLFGRIDVADLHNERGYSPNKAYGDGKLANILFTKELHRRHGAEGISAAAFHPGTVATNFAADSTSIMRWVYRTPLRHLVLTSPEAGADTLLWLARGIPGHDWAPGEYYEKRRPTRTNPQADDGALAAALWEESARLVGLAPQATSG